MALWLEALGPWLLWTLSSGADEDGSVQEQAFALALMGCSLILFGPAEMTVSIQCQAQYSMLGTQS